MDKCKAVGKLIVGGRHVGWLRCGLESWHVDHSPLLTGTPVIPHRAVLEWTEDTLTLEDWPEAYDADEAFDLNVELVAPAVEVPPVPESVCGYSTGSSGACVFTPHRLGTPHSWAPPLPTQRPGETILDAERRERRGQ